MGGPGSGRRPRSYTVQSDSMQQSSSSTLPLPGSSMPLIDDEANVAYTTARDEAAQNTKRNAQESRPINTILAYATPQKEWKAWCAKMGINEIPDDGKLHLFLRQEVSMVYALYCYCILTNAPLKVVFREHLVRGRKRKNRDTTTATSSSSSAAVPVGVEQAWYAHKQILA